MIVEKIYDFLCSFQNFHEVKGYPFLSFTLINVFGLKKAFGERKVSSAALRLLPDEKIFEFFFQKISFLMFQVREKRLSSLMRIPSGIFGHGTFNKLLTKVSLAYLRNFITVLNLEQGANLGRSRLVLACSEALF